MLKFVIIGFVNIYKWIISPYFPNACRYSPTCSSYMIEAVKKYGAIKGGWIGLKRIMRCHPFSGSGFDPLK